MTTNELSKLRDELAEMIDNLDRNRGSWIFQVTTLIDFVVSKLTLSESRVRGEMVEMIKKRRKEVNIFSPETGDKFIDDIIKKVEE